MNYWAKFNQACHETSVRYGDLDLLIKLKGHRKGQTWGNFGAFLKKYSIEEPLNQIWPEASLEHVVLSLLKWLSHRGT